MASGTSSFRQQICPCIHSLEREGRRWGQESTREPHSLLLPFPHHPQPPIPLPVAQPPGRGQGLAGGWGGTPAPVQGVWSQQLSTGLGLSVLFLEGLLRDECPKRIIPEACADAKTCGQGRESSAHGTTIIKVLQKLCVNW